MKLKQNTTKRKIAISLLVVGVLAVGGVSGYMFMRNNSTQAAAATKTEAAVSVFTFTGATDWRQGPSNETSMAVFGKARKNGTSACFVSMEYKTGTVDEATQLQEDYATIAGGGHTATALGAQTLTLRTALGDKQYSLHQFKVTSPEGAGQLMEGTEIGYLQLREGYVKVIGNCETAEELSSTLSALQAYSLAK